MTRLSWTQPICETCWKSPPIRDTGGWGGDPSRLLQPEEERCSFCGDPTSAGIYVRHDPAAVSYPAEKED